MTKIGDFNLESNELTVRDMNEEELAQLENDIKADEAAKILEENVKALKETALAKLTALGLDVEDLKVLGLG